MTDRDKSPEPERKNLGAAPEDKAIGNNLRPGQRTAKEGEEPDPDADAYGTVHVMEQEMKAAALDKAPGAENQPPQKPSVVHLMELEMKGEAIEEYVESHPHIDAGLPEPEEPPLGAKPTQYPTTPDRRGGPGKRR
jgi:hypothetical protein